MALQKYKSDHNKTVQQYTQQQSRFQSHQQYQQYPNQQQQLQQQQPSSFILHSISSQYNSILSHSYSCFMSAYNAMFHIFSGPLFANVEGYVYLDLIVWGISPMLFLIIREKIIKIIKPRIIIRSNKQQYKQHLQQQQYNNRPQQTHSGNLLSQLQIHRRHLTFIHHRRLLLLILWSVFILISFLFMNYSQTFNWNYFTRIINLDLGYLIFDLACRCMELIIQIQEDQEIQEKQGQNEKKNIMRMKKNNNNNNCNNNSNTNSNNNNNKINSNSNNNNNSNLLQNTSSLSQLQTCRIYCKSKNISTFLSYFIIFFLYTNLFQVTQRYVNIYNIYYYIYYNNQSGKDVLAISSIISCFVTFIVPFLYYMHFKKKYFKKWNLLREIENQVKMKIKVGSNLGKIGKKKEKDRQFQKVYCEDDEEQYNYGIHLINDNVQFKPKDSLDKENMKLLQIQDIRRQLNRIKYIKYRQNINPISPPTNNLFSSNNIEQQQKQQQHHQDNQPSTSSFLPHFFPLLFTVPFSTPLLIFCLINISLVINISYLSLWIMQCLKHQQTYIQYNETLLVVSTFFMISSVGYGFMAKVNLNWGFQPGMANMEDNCCCGKSQILQQQHQQFNQISQYQYQQLQQQQLQLQQQQQPSSKHITYSQQPYTTINHFQSHSHSFNHYFNKIIIFILGLLLILSFTLLKNNIYLFIIQTMFIGYHYSLMNYLYYKIQKQLQHYQQQQNLKINLDLDIIALYIQVIFYHYYYYSIKQFYRHLHIQLYLLYQQYLILMIIHIKCMEEQVRWGWQWLHGGCDGWIEKE